MRPQFTWRLKSRSLALGARTLVMGVVNVTPDSFADAGRYFDLDKAVEHALQLLDQGADILDIGGESTRPGAPVQPKRAALSSRATRSRSAGARSRGTPARQKQRPVTAAMEMKRILPVIAAVKCARPDAILSVDTYKASVARAAVDAGAEIVNDVSGFRWDPAMASTIAALGCGAVLMHTRGRPEEWRHLPPVDDLVALVSRELAGCAITALDAGIARDCLALDPGFGFGKNFEENYPLLARFDEFHRLGYPLLAGTSRKSFIGRALAGRRGAGVSPAQAPPPELRLYGSLAAMVITILKGAHIVRVHDVRAAVEAAAVCDAIIKA